MAIKITELRQKFDTMSDAEKAAAYEAAVEAKIAELKIRYKKQSDEAAKKDNSWSEQDWRTLAENCLKEENAINIQSYYYGHPGVENDPELAMWVQYTYEEILQMEAGGVVIPEEILVWAHSMQDNDVTSYQVEDMSAEEMVDELDNSDLSQMEKAAKKLGEKSKKANEDTNKKYIEFQQLASRAEDIQKEQKASQKAGLEEIQELTAEYSKFADKIRKGEQLSDVEKRRYQTLNTMLNGKDGEIMSEFQTSNSELEDLINSMDNLDKDIIANIELGNDAIAAANELSLQEKSHRTTNVEPNFFINVSTGQAVEAINAANGQTLANEIFQSGNNLVQFSDTLNNILLTNQYTSLYEFATHFTSSAEEAINHTKEVMGEDFDKSSKELNTEETEEMPSQKEEDVPLTMSDLTTLGFGTKELTKKVQETGKASASVEEQAIQAAKEHNSEQKRLNQRKIELETEQTEAVEEASEVEQAETAQVEEEGTQEAEKPKTEEKQAELQEKSKEIIDINSAIKASNLEGVGAKEKLQKATEVNKQYTSFNNEAANVMNKTTAVGTITTVMGEELVVGGTSYIAIGTALLADPFTFIIGADMILCGGVMLALGTEFVGIGGNLMAVGFKGLDETIATGEQVEDTDATIEKAENSVATGEEIEEEEKTQAEKEKEQMQDDGVSTFKQLFHFVGKSIQEAAISTEDLVLSEYVKLASYIEGESSQKLVEKVEKNVAKDKVEFDELAEKREKAQETDEKIANADPEDFKNLDFDSLEEFTEKDQQKLEKIQKQLQTVGDVAQNKLYQSLTQVEGLEELLADIDVDALRAIDYGKVTQELALDIMKRPLLPIIVMFVISALVSGKIAEEAGVSSDENEDVAKVKNNLASAKISNSQNQVTELTTSEEMSAYVENDQAKNAPEFGEDKKIGTTLPDLARDFRDKSSQSAFEASEEVVGISVAETTSNLAGKSSENLASRVEKTMSDKKSEYDELAEKKEASEEANEKALQRSKIASKKGINAEPEVPESEFTQNDEQKMEKLADQLQTTGDKAQERLYNSLEQVVGLEEFLADKDEKALETMDYGEIAQIVGKALVDRTKSNVLLMHQMILGLSTKTSGNTAVEMGKALDEVTASATNTTDVNKTKISGAQRTVSDVTMSQAMEVISSTETSTDEESNESVEQVAESTQEAKKAAAKQPVGAAAIVASMQGSKYVDQARQNVGMETKAEKTGGNNNSDNTSKAKDNSEQEGKALLSEKSQRDQQIAGGKKSISEAQKEHKDASKVAKNDEKDAKKDEKQLEKESKNIIKLIDRDSQKIEKLSEESRAAVEEQMTLIAEYEQLNAQVQEANEKIAASQQQSAAPQQSAPAGEEGGLLSSQPKSQDSSTQQYIATVNTNQSRMGEISTRFTVLDDKITKNRVQISKHSTSVNQKYRKFNKISKEKLKIQKAHQKEQKKKQERMKKLNAAIEVVNSVFSVVSSVGSIMTVVGQTMAANGKAQITAGTALIAAALPLLTNPFTAAAGIAQMAAGIAQLAVGIPLEATGEVVTGVGGGFTYAGIAGVAACGVTKAGIALANGDIKGALMQLGSTIVSVAMNFVPGVGGAANTALSSTQAGLQIASASLNIVSSTANVAANSQTLAGQEQSAWLNTTAQIAGTAGSLVNAGAGLADLGKGLGAAAKIASAAGSIASATATSSTLIKQAMGEDPGKFEEIMGLIGYGLSTAGAIMSLMNAAGIGEGNNSSDGTNESSENASAENTSTNETGTSNDNANKTETQEQVTKVSDDLKELVKNAYDGFDSSEGIPSEIENRVMSELDKLPPEYKEKFVAEFNKVKENAKSAQNPETPASEEADAEVEEVAELPEIPEETVTGAAADVAQVEEVNAEINNTIEEVDDVTAKVTENTETVEEIENFDANETEQTEEINKAEQAEEQKLSRKEQKAQEEKEFVDKVKSENGLEPGKQKIVNGKKFEVTEDGKFMVDGKEVTPGEMHAKMKAASATSDASKKSFDDTKVGETQVIDGNVFEKQEDGTFKMVTGYNEKMERNLSEQAFASDELHNVNMGTDEQKAQWQQDNLANIENTNSELTPEMQQVLANQVAEQQGLAVGKSELIDGHTFEVTKDGQCLVDGKQVHPGEMRDKMTVAKANSDSMKQQLANCKDGESVFINGQEFVKNAGADGKDASFKLVSSYDKNFEQQTINKEFTANEVHKVGMMSEDKATNWADTQINNDKMQKGFQKTTEIIGKVTEVASGVSQIAGTVQGFIPEEKEERNILYLSNKKKGEALMRKIRSRRDVRGYNPYR